MGMVQFMNDSMSVHAWLSCEVFIHGNVCSEALFKGIFFSLKILSLTSREIGYKVENISLRG